MEWKVTNALNRDVERQQLNKILAEIRVAVDKPSTQTGSPAGNVKELVGEMVSGNVEEGVSVTYTSSTQTLDFAVSNFTIRLAGDVTGSGEVNALRNVTIQTELDPSKVGIGEAPMDGSAYWRSLGQWEAAPESIAQLGGIDTAGFLVHYYDSDEQEVYETREFEAVTGELVVNNPDGSTGNVSYGLADLADSGIGISPIQLYTRDSKGRIEGSEDASTDDLPEGVANLYFTEERAQDAVVVASITDEDTNHSPSGEAVFEALALKADTSSLGTMAFQNADAVAITGGTMDGVIIDGGTF